MTHELIPELVNNEERNDLPCQKVLGSLEALYKMDNVWAECAKEIQMIGMSEQLNWIAGNEFDRDEMEAFKQGLAAIPDFLHRCSLEAAEINKQIEAPE